MEHKTEIPKEEQEKISIITGGGMMTPEGQAKPMPFSVLITFKNNPPTIEDMKIGGEVSKEFFDIIGPDAEGLPDCIESVIIKRSQ